jgi:catechol 2,3-dioxygenase-like lactoylglutathione lyase family enzyme
VIEALSGFSPNLAPPTISQAEARQRRKWAQRPGMDPMQSCHQRGRRVNCFALVRGVAPRLRGSRCLCPGSRTGALGPIASIYLRDPDGNLIEISNYREA